MGTLLFGPSRSFALAKLNVHLTNQINLRQQITALLYLREIQLLDMSSLDRKEESFDHDFKRVIF